MISIRSGGGLGDNIYLQSIVRYMLDRGEKIEVVTRKPIIFEPLKNRCTISAFRRTGINRIAHYTSRKGILETTQYQDMLINARLPLNVPFETVWPIKPNKFVDEIKKRAKEKKIVMINQPQAPMDRSDGFGIELLSDSKFFLKTVQMLKDLNCFTVIAHTDKAHFPIKICDYEIPSPNFDDLCQLTRNVDLMYGQVSHFLPLSEGFGTPMIALFTDTGLRSKHIFVRQIVPQKVLCAKTSTHIVDTYSDDQIVNEFKKRLNL